MAEDRDRRLARIWYGAALREHLPLVAGGVVALVVGAAILVFSTSGVIAVGGGERSLAERDELLSGRGANFERQRTALEQRGFASAEASRLNRSWLTRAVLTSWVLTWTASQVAAQEVEVFGFWRSDGVVLPALYLTEGGWSAVRYTLEAGAYSAVEHYYARDSLGAAVVVRAREPVFVCCDETGEGIWGHATDVSGPDVEMYASGRQGYVLSSAGSEAPFRSSSQSVDANRVRAILDSISPIRPDRETRVDTRVWRSEVDDLSGSFFQVRQSGSTDGWVACFYVFGWLLPTGSQEAKVEIAGEDDCERKGAGERRPVTLLHRGGELYAIVEVLLYDGRAVEVWQRSSESGWERIVGS